MRERQSGEITACASVNLLSEWMRGRKKRSSKRLRATSATKYFRLKAGPDPKAAPYERKDS